MGRICKSQLTSNISTKRFQDPGAKGILKTQPYQNPTQISSFSSFVSSKYSSLNRRPWLTSFIICSALSFSTSPCFLSMGYYFRVIVSLPVPRTLCGHFVLYRLAWVPKTKHVFSLSPFPLKPTSQFLQHQLVNMAIACPSTKPGT